MKIVIPGGSGQVGGLLVTAFGPEHDVVVLSRNASSHSGNDNLARYVAWDGKYLGNWAGEIDGADVVINLAGRSVNCRYHQRNRRALMDSRVDSTRVIGEAIARASSPPKVWLQMSTATIYAHRYDGANDEATGILGGMEQDAPDTWRFSIDVAKAWEQALADCPTPNTRQVLMRSAIVMNPDAGSAFDVLLRLVRFGLGGKQGDGRQFVSWVHEHDFARALAWLIEHDEIDGPVNIASPNPLPNAAFMRALREAWGAKIGLPAAKWMLEIGTFVMRSESELVLKSRRVVPRRLLDAGFEFDYPTWPAAASDLVARLREWNTHSTTPSANENLAHGPA